MVSIVVPAPRGAWQAPKISPRGLRNASGKKNLTVSYGFLGFPGPPGSVLRRSTTMCNTQAVKPQAGPTSTKSTWTTSLKCLARGIVAGRRGCVLCFSRQMSQRRQRAAATIARGAPAMARARASILGARCPVLLRIRIRAFCWIRSMAFQASAACSSDTMSCSSSP